MRKGLPYRDWLWIALFALAFQLYWTLRLPEPTHMDAYYYATNGMRLALGEGFTEQVAWQFLDAKPQDAPVTFPIPSHSYWMPLPSLMAALGYKLLPTFRGMQLPFLIMSGFLPLVAYAIAWQLDGSRARSRVAALLTATGGFYTLLWNQPETFLPFAWSGSLALYFMALGLVSSVGARSRWRYWLIAGALSGLAHLSRADGVLFFGLGGLLLVAQYASTPIRKILQNGLVFVAGYLILAGPWLIRNWLEFGTPLSIAGTQTIFLTSYDELFAFGRAITRQEYWAWGIGNIVSSKVAGASTALQTLIAVCGLIFLAPLMLIGWRQARKSPTGATFLRPFGWYTLLLFTALSLIFTFPGIRGGLFHSTTALWPWFMALAPAGLHHTIHWISQRRSSWNPDEALRVFYVGLVALAVGFTFFLGGERAQTDTVVGQHYGAIGDSLPLDAVVIVRNPPGFYYATGRSAISVPNESINGLLAAATHYQANYLILDTDHPQPLTALYQNADAIPQIDLISTHENVKLYAITLSELP